MWIVNRCESYASYSKPLVMIMNRDEDKISEMTY